MVIWENVPGLLWKFQDCMEYYQEVMDEFGYYSYHKILTASDYNIPQNRDRVFVVSILKDVPGADRFEFPEKMTPQWTLKDFIDKKVSFNDPAVQLKDAEKAILGTLPDGTLTVRDKKRLRRSERVADHQPRDPGFKKPERTRWR